MAARASTAAALRPYRDWIGWLTPPILRDTRISRQSRFDVRWPSNGRSCEHGGRSPALSRKKAL